MRDIVKRSVKRVLTKSRRAGSASRRDIGQKLIVRPFLRVFADAGAYLSAFSFETPILDWTTLAESLGGLLTNHAITAGLPGLNAWAVARDEGARDKGKRRGRGQDLRMDARDQRTRLRERRLSNQCIRNRPHAILVGGKCGVERYAGRFVEGQRNMTQI